nr:unnamed protein product [Digitaria exilis]
MWKKDLPIFLRPCRTSHPSCRTAAGAGPAEAPLVESSPLRAIPDGAGGRWSSPLLAASRLDADELSISLAHSQLESSGGPPGLVKQPSTGGDAAGGGGGRTANCGGAAWWPESGERRRGAGRGEEAKDREFETGVNNYDQSRYEYYGVVESFGGCY